MMYSLNRLVLSIVMCVYCICGCSVGDRSIQGDVLQNVPSPDASANAVLTKSANGATVSFVYRLYLQDRVTGKVAEVLRADRIGAVNIEWKGNQLVSVELSCGRIFTYQNFVDILDKDGALHRSISVALAPVIPCSK